MGVEVVYFSRVGFEGHVLEHCAEFDSIVDLGLFLGTEVNALGIAATLNIEDTLTTPNMLIITNQLPIPNSTQRSLASPRQPKEKRNIAILPNITTRMQGKMSLLRHEVVHDCEYTFFHLACVLGA